MNVKQKRLAVLDETVGISQVGLALANGLYLGAAEGNPCLEFLQQKIVMAGHSIVRGIPLAGGHGITRPYRLFRAGNVRLNNHMAGFASHWEASSNLHPSIKAISMARRWPLQAITPASLVQDTFPVAESRATAGLC